MHSSGRMASIADVFDDLIALVNDGSKPDKVFKDKDVNFVAKALKEYCGEIVSPTQVYNHLRKWRQRWVRVVKLRELSGALWNEDTCAITLEDEHYKGHVKVCLPVKLIEVICCIHNFFFHKLTCPKYILGTP